MKGNPKQRNPKQCKPKRTITGHGTFRGHPIIYFDVEGGEDEACYASDGVPTPQYGNSNGVERPRKGAPVG